jgi:membrane protein implicated in regulation of membrane protease activity/DNA-binding ferritin-like protein (Dps family)
MENRVRDRHGIDRIVADCENYWLQTGVPRQAVSEMKAELVTYLDEALAEGKGIRSVVGDDLAGFAESWALEQRGSVSPDAWRAAQRRREWTDVRAAYGWLAATVGFVVILIAVAPKEDAVESMEVWRWIWLGAFVVLGIGEMVTAGLFMLPFAIGAAAAGALAWFEVVIWLQLSVFLLVSIGALWGMRKFAWRSSEPSFAVGAKRYVDAAATVTESIDRVAGTGRVRMDTELWRATTDIDAVIESGTEVVVASVRGARLVVEPRLRS